MVHSVVPKQLLILGWKLDTSVLITGQATSNISLISVAILSPLIAEAIAPWIQAGIAGGKLLPFR